MVQLCLAAVVLLFPARQLTAGSKARLIEVDDGSNTYAGCLVSKDASRCFLIDQFGELICLPLANLESFRIVGEKFDSASLGEFRRRLRSEFRSEYEVQTSAHYVVVGRKGRAKAYAELFEEIYDQVSVFYSIRGFATTSPQFPLVAIVLSTVDDFKDYCGKDQVLWSSELRGYYSLKTNRVVLYEDSTANSVTNASTRLKDAATATESRDTAFHGEEQIESAAVAAIMNAVSGETAATMIHETTHQVGYNTGIHSRIGTTPAWAIEGLAMVLESPGMRRRVKSSECDKLNSARFDWFRNQYLHRRQQGDLAQLAASDEMFTNQTLDAYSVSWAFTWFLTENPARARLFVQYMKLLSQRDPALPYTPDQRLQDFQSAFGDIARLEVDFLRAMERLSAGSH